MWLRGDLTFDASSKNMNDARFKRLCTIMNRNPDFAKVSNLHLYDNKLTSVAFEYMLNLNTSNVQRMWLGHNHIRSQGVFTMTQVDWPSLVDLFLDDNYIDDSGAHRILECSRKSGPLSSVTRLGMHANCLTNNATHALRLGPFTTVWVGSQRR
jgi:hypothetical protein